MLGHLKKMDAAELVLLLVIGIFTACGSPQQDPNLDQQDAKPEPEPIGNQQPIPPLSNINCPNGTYLTYENFGGAFLNNYCTSCHATNLPETQRFGAPLESNFDSAYLAQVWRAEILMHTGGDAPAMPPNRFVTAEERRELAEWLNCGAPER